MPEAFSRATWVCMQDKACKVNQQSLQTLPLIVNVSPLYDVLVTCALRLSDGEIF